MSKIIFCEFETATFDKAFFGSSYFPFTVSHFDCVHRRTSLS
jgi:hypothetical protein